MNEMLEAFRPIFRMLWGAFFLVIALKLFFWRWNSPKQKGKRGEKIVARRLRKGLPAEYLILNDIYLPLPDGTTATLGNVVDGDVVGVTVTGATAAAGTHTAEASALTGDDAGNYKLPAANTTTFEIKDSGIVIQFL